MNREKLVDELLADECVGGKPALKLYLDSKGIPTIGIGHNLKVPITLGAAYYICNDDIDAVEADLNTALKWWVRLDEVRQRVLFNMCFNMGIARLMGFEKFLGYAFVGKWDDAAREMLDSKWAREDVQPARSSRLAEMMRTGKEPDDAKAAV
jgi:lysozyme